jgi:hypothetical protein
MTTAGPRLIAILTETPPSDRRMAHSMAKRPHAPSSRIPITRDHYPLRSALFDLDTACSNNRQVSAMERNDLFTQIHIMAFIDRLI